MSSIGRTIYKTIWGVVGFPIALVCAAILLFDPRESVQVLEDWWRVLWEI